MKAKMSVTGFWSRLVIAATVALAAVPAAGQLHASIDTDAETPGVQPERLVVPGELITLAIHLAVGDGGLSSYSLGVRYDEAELDPVGPMVEFLGANPPHSLLRINFDPGVRLLTGGRLGTWEAATFANGPVNDAFDTGTMTFMVKQPINDGVPDLEFFIPGPPDFGDGGFFDNASDQIVRGGTDFTSLMLSSGFIVPEPATLGALAGGLLLVVCRRRLR